MASPSPRTWSAQQSLPYKGIMGWEACTSGPQRTLNHRNVTTTRFRPEMGAESKSSWARAHSLAMFWVMKVVWGANLTHTNYPSPERLRIVNPWSLGLAHVITTDRLSKVTGDRAIFSIYIEWYIGMCLCTCICQSMRANSSPPGTLSREFCSHSQCGETHKDIGVCMFGKEATSNISSVVWTQRLVWQQCDLYPIEISDIFSLKASFLSTLRALYRGCNLA